jgi:hypothetical protein
MLCSVPRSVVLTGFLCEVNFINELRIMAGAGWVLVKVGPGVHVGVVGHREVVGAIAGSGRWADAGDHVGQKGEALQAGGSMPAGALEHDARLGGGGVGCRVGGGDVLGRYLVVEALGFGACVGEGGIDRLVCGDVLPGWQHGAARRAGSHDAA